MILLGMKTEMLCLEKNYPHLGRISCLFGGGRRLMQELFGRVREGEEVLLMLVSFCVSIGKGFNGT
jgi:hypothetical protein